MKIKIKKFLAEPNPAGSQIDLSYEVYPYAPLRVDELSNLEGDALKVNIWRKEDDFEFSIKRDVVYDYKTYKRSVISSTILSQEKWLKVECIEEEDSTTKLKRWMYTYYTDATTIDHLKVIIADRGREESALKSQILYYYQIIPKKSKSCPLLSERRAAAMATANYNSTDTLYNWLPRIYRASDKEGKLKKFLEIFASQFDLIRSFTEGLLNIFDLEHCDYELLSLYAQWIGWNLSFQSNVRLQRHEIRYAVDLYRRMGTIPGCELMVKRLSGWECRIKEFYKNIFFSNDINSRSVDTSESQLLRNIHTFKDSLHYTYDTGLAEDDWYSFNTVGLFVSLIKSESYASIIGKKKKIENNFNLFLPVNIRGIVIIEGLVVKDSYKEDFDLLGSMKDYSTYE